MFSVTREITFCYGHRLLQHEDVVGGWIDENLDHRMLLHRDDPLLPLLAEQGEPVFVLDANPTAENIARLIFDLAASQGFPVAEVTLWETETSCAAYAGPRRPPRELIGGRDRTRRRPLL